jgi:hypothetical protein
LSDVSVDPVADKDERVVAGAAVGSLAVDGGDRFSDLDLTFGIADLPMCSTTGRAGLRECPRPESNQRTRFRKALLQSP